MRPVPISALLLLAACGPRSASPVCGFGLVAGPTVIAEQLSDSRMIVTAAPRGLPQTLPATVGGRSGQSTVAVGYDPSRNLVLAYQGDGFPAPGAGYALLVVDDTSQRVEGVVIYDANGPKGVPLGTVTGPPGTNPIPLYGVRVDWTGVSNPKCPLLGDSGAAAR